MSIRYEKLDKTCKICNSSTQRVFIKNPYIDDFEDECTNVTCSDFGEGLDTLESRSRSAAREEEG